MTTLTLSIRSINHKIHALSLPRPNWKTMYIFGITLIVLMLISYSFLINKITGEAYVIKNDTKQIETLSQENKSLEINFAKSDFLANIMEQAQGLSFEKTTNIKYVQMLESSLAQAK